MNWDDIRYFLAVCREGSVSGAGARLGVTHTTVSRRVSALETKLGTRLFDRTAEGYVMTQGAENLYSHALAMEETAHAIDRRAFGLDAELRGSLKVTAPYDFCNNVLIPSLDRFFSTYPLIDLELLTTTGLVDLTAREADLAIRLTPKPPDYLIGREVLPLRHGIYAVPRCLKAARGTPNVILFRGDPAEPEWVGRHFAGAQIAFRTDNVSSMLAAVRAGLGVARLPCFIADAENRVRRLDLPLEPSVWGIWVLSHADLRSTARVRAAREFFTNVIEAQRALVLGEKSRYL